ncbi:hypothetical protein AGR2A_Cc30199 [Agrobacterium genomosp. 2 str. CFBP 5494]|uniref:Uncharacterized protein n=1 Tax=Agrobacterium genomosp. 2 str. CFBP 5494 TaxID=1183436 RepID=A0A9W5F0P6_9HYPH|nr:hypothetical protein AGR2A_Cc30199 [Agrobacterium genomosp. 2 str. CFBP 5494]
MAATWPRSNMPAFPMTLRPWPKSTPSPRRFSPRNSQPCRTSATLPLQTGANIMKPSTSSSRESRASRTRSRGASAASRTVVTSRPTLSGSSGTCAPVTSSSKTSRNTKPSTAERRSTNCVPDLSASGTRLTISSSMPRKSCRSVESGCSFSDVAEMPADHLLRYSLTPRAAAGVLRRAERHGYRLPMPLLEALLSCIRRGSAR